MYKPSPMQTFYGDPRLLRQWIKEMETRIARIPSVTETKKLNIEQLLKLSGEHSNIDYSLFNVIVLFWLSLIETFGYSYLGSQLMEEVNGVGKAIYDMPWYEHSQELQRYYRLMLQRVQRPTRITGVFLPWNWVPSEV
ncbi:conserved hypothetical protein [Culex quinquefasciatus]|uniref:Odorant receptor n=1 Tax=Culex quinquefasciatus TaxID=7176 RepID=B0WAZ5_CULQU|nr:conserved hypothetical protein [Culex quinquefasciatus]|eukprot:XP_001845879.1 conserved hypothetical protein [Culex quinquefasciatus]